MRKFFYNVHDLFVLNVHMRFIFSLDGAEPCSANKKEINM